MPFRAILDTEQSACTWRRSTSGTQPIGFASNWHGREVRRSAHTTSKATAQQFLAQLLDEHRRLDRGGRPRRAYREALKRFTYDYLPTLKPRTQERYRTSFRQLHPVFGTLYLDEITRARLADYASDRMKAGAKGATVRRDLATLSCLCSCAVSWDFIVPVPPTAPLVAGGLWVRRK
jgi:hypothetical protein